MVNVLCALNLNPALKKMYVRTAHLFTPKDIFFIHNTFLYTYKNVLYIKKEQVKMTLTTFVHAYSTAQAFSSSYRTSQQLKVDVPRMEKEWLHISFLFFHGTSA